LVLSLPTLSCLDKANYKFHQRSRNPELLSLSDLHPAALEQSKENLLIQLPWAVLVGIAKGRSAWSSDSQMFQFTLTASQSPGNLPEGMGSTQLTEEHGNKLTPASEPSGMAFCFCLSHGLLELDSRKQTLENSCKSWLNMLQNLIIICPPFAVRLIGEINLPQKQRQGLFF